MYSFVILNPIILKMINRLEVICDRARDAKQIDGPPIPVDRSFGGFKGLDGVDHFDATIAACSRSMFLDVIVLELVRLGTYDYHGITRPRLQGWHGRSVTG